VALWLEAQRAFGGLQRQRRMTRRECARARIDQSHGALVLPRTEVVER
jgi:hypothetical protein